MIIIAPRHPRRGSGIFGDIIKKVTSTGVKKVIKRAVTSATAHKLAEAVVNGAVSGTEKLVENTIADLKRKEEPIKKNIKIDISDLINSGSGIVLD